MAHLSRKIIQASASDPATKKLLRRLTGTDLVAAAGSAQSDAGLLTARVNLVTGANGTLAVRLPPSEIDMAVTVVNTVAAALPVFPDPDDAINAGGANTVFSQVASSERTYYVSALGQWYVEAKT